MTVVEEALLSVTIWLAILLFVAGDIGKRRAQLSAARASWGWRLWGAGAILCAAHMVLAFAVRHGWSHRAALDATALETQAVYGVAWGAGLYVNYVFLAAWLAEAVWWRAAPGSYFARSRRVTWMLRVFYFIVLVNASVIFATRWILGTVLMGLLLWSWRPVGR